MSASTQNLTIVLLCSGNGADPSNYRPSRDDVRYRHRHDALVRCVAASLYGPSGVDNDGTCEVILLYDGDLACIRMTLQAASSSSLNTMMPVPPTEREVVTSWREAAKAAVRCRQQNQHLPKYSSIGNIGAIKTNDLLRNSSKSDNRKNSNANSQLKTVCVLDSWKAVESINSSTNDGDACIKEEFTSQNPKHSKEGPSMKKLPSQMPSSKRDVLTSLQSTCPVDYLRQHHLNVPLDVALRRTNKNKLQNAWKSYAKYCSEHCLAMAKSETSSLEYGEVRRSSGHKNERDDMWQKVEKTFRSILSEANVGIKSNSAPGPISQQNSSNVLAAYLHESCDSELPCWGWDNLHRNKNDDVKHIFLFLGAVRDMTTAENEALLNACNALRIPLIPCRLGPVPEFTSKIVSVAGFHHSRGVLGDGLVHLWKRVVGKQKDIEPSPKRRKIDKRATEHPRTIHNIAIVPMISTSLTSDPDKRDRIHWCIVRMCVCSLWRSKLASSSNSDDGAVSPLNNIFTFLFLDGVCITLNQRDFTSSMAENHKAAPSELQILEELCRRRDLMYSTSAKNQDKSREIDDDAIKCACLNFVSAHTSLNHGEKVFALNIMPYNQLAFDRMSLFDMAYSNASLRSYCASTYTLYTIQEIGVDQRHTSEAKNNSTPIRKKATEVRKQLLRAFSDRGIVSMDHSTLICTSLQKCQEEESCTIIMLQHLDYHHRLLPLLLEYESKQKQTSSW